MQQLKTQKSSLDKQRDYNDWLRGGGDQITWTKLKASAWKSWEEGRVKGFPYVFAVAYYDFEHYLTNSPSEYEGAVFIFHDGNSVEGISETFDGPFKKGTCPYEKCHNLLKELKYEELVGDQSEERE